MSQKKATIVNLAASSVSVSQFSVEAGSLVLEQLFVEEIAPGQLGDDDWLNAAIAALANLVNTHELKGRVTVIAPAFLLLQKPLKVAQVERARYQLAEVIGEAARLVLPQPSGVNLIPRDIAAQQAFDARKPRLVAAALLGAIAPFCVWLAFASAEGWNQAQADIAKGRKAELVSRLTAINESRRKADDLFAKTKELEQVLLGRPNWPAFLGDLQSRVGTLKNTWVEEMRVKYEPLPAAPIVEGQPIPPPEFVTKVVISVRFLFTEVSVDEKRYRSQAEKAHLSSLLQALRQSPFVSAVPENEIVVTDQTMKAADNKTEIRMTPKATLTLVIRKDMAL